LIFNEKLIFV